MKLVNGSGLDSVFFTLSTQSTLHCLHHSPVPTHSHKHFFFFALSLDVLSIKGNVFRVFMNEAFLLSYNHHVLVTCETFKM